MSVEICNRLIKSILKKSGSPIVNKSKKVTFCNTVKAFIDERNIDKKIDIIDSKGDCVEIKIVDKSNDDSTITYTADDCNVTDFLVHKVVYEDDIEHGDTDGETDTLSEDVDENLDLFNTSNDEEALQFVVHKVTDHEDDLIQQELEFESRDSNINNPDIESGDNIVGKLSELSIENILTHDKIIAFIDQKSLGLAALLKNHISLSEIDSIPCLENPVQNSVDSLKVSSCLKNSELVLSPPLQELSLDKIVKAQSNNVLCELDISPLNSIQETDSESDISSEGTMIMMTTEESEKNEQHIRESFQKYESLMKIKSQTKDLTDDSCAQISDIGEKQNIAEKIVQNTYDSTTDACCEDISDNPNKKEYSYFETGMVPQNPTEIAGVPTDSKLEFVKKVRSTSVPNNSKGHSVKEFNISPVPKERRVSFAGINNPCTWDKSLESIQIPKDVREWKINVSSEKYSRDCLNSDSSTLTEDECSALKTNIQPLECSSNLYSFTLPEDEYSVSNFHPQNCSSNFYSPALLEDGYLASKSIVKSQNYSSNLYSSTLPEDECLAKSNAYPQNCTSNFVSSTSPDDEYSASNTNIHPQNLRERMNSPKSDELENFVHASKERVQRIRKRYFDRSPKRNGFLNSSVRGIRPRFCSTAEILRMLERKNQPPYITFSNRNHVSWPCDTTISNPHANVPNKGPLSHMFGCQMLPGEYSLQSFNSYGSEDSSSSTCDHDSVSSCPSIFFHERGNPEGASPPRSLSSDSIEKYTDDESPNNVVYFSMKV